MIELSVIVPTFNETDNVGELVERLETVLQGIGWEVIFVDDDSPDGTSDKVRSMAASDHRVRCIQRVGRRGLSSACIEGMLSSSATFVAVMDGDLQHDETVLPRMLSEARDNGTDLVVGSRYVEGGGTSDWSEQRKSISLLAIRMAKAVTRVDIEDITSGYFLANRQAILPAIRNTSGIGFKILLDIALSSKKPLSIKEIPYHFRSRKSGESKLDYQAAWQYLLLLADKKVGRFVPVRFLSFAFVGGLGVFVHMATLTAFYKAAGVAFVIAQSIATLVAMTSNFFLNNVLTYSDKRLKGLALLKGWLSFVLACSIGAVANVGVANYFFLKDVYWAGSAIAGILIGVVWNYAVTAAYTWKQ